MTARRREPDYTMDCKMFTEGPYASNCSIRINNRCTARRGPKYLYAVSTTADGRYFNLDYIHVRRTWGADAGLKVSFMHSNRKFLFLFCMTIITHRRVVVFGSVPKAKD